MAKQEKASLINMFEEFKELKNIDCRTLISIMEESFRNVIAKNNGTDKNYTVVVNPNTGDVEIRRTRIVVADGEVEDPNAQIPLSEALLIQPDYEIDEEVEEPVELSSFGRRSVLNLRQMIASKILDVQKDLLYEKYKDMIGQIIRGEVYQVWKKEVLLLDDEGNELLLPKNDQIGADFFKKGDNVKAVVVKVENVNNNPKIFVSRTSPLFLQRMMEQEIPEIHDGLIEIKRVVRVPGDRAKVAVESYDENIDAVGACVGVKGSRIYGIVRELKNESIDIIQYAENPTILVKRALAPAEVASLDINYEERRINVYLRQDQISLAIGKGGSNIKLATMISGYTIDVYRNEQFNDEEDIYLSEFDDEIEPWVINVLKQGAGCTTAKDVLRMSREQLLRATDLEEETIDDVIRILKTEFED